MFFPEPFTDQSSSSHSLVDFPAGSYKVVKMFRGFWIGLVLDAGGGSDRLRSVSTPDGETCSTGDTKEANLVE